MRIDEQFKRCVRIRAVFNTKIGRDVVIEDAETGEAIPHIARVVITLIPNELVIADFTYLEIDEGTGWMTTRGGNVVEKHILSSNIEIDLTALERMRSEKRNGEDDGSSPTE
jgi:hypothetical protein